MAIDLLKDKGTPLEQQCFTWKELVQAPYSKLDVDAMTRVRIILMNGVESNSVRFQHLFSRMNAELLALADKAGEHELSKQFERACLEEREHLVKVRGWLAAHHKAA